MSLKEDIYAACFNEIDNRILFFQKIINDLKEGSENDSKSSAGDKHETSRAMMQIEQEKVGKQLNEVYEMKRFLEKIDASIQNKQVGLGSLIKTNMGYFYIAVALGKIKINNEEIFIISPKSPFGLKLSGATKNMTIKMNANIINVEEVI